MGRTRIKICGIKDTETALVAARAGADAVGFIFAKNSPRYIDPDDAQDIMFALPPMVASVGVFMNHSPDAFTDIEESCPTTHTQLHGNEDERVVQQCGPAIKAIRYGESTIAADIKRWAGCEDVEALLIDGPTPGEGITFKWELLPPLLAGVEIPVFLAGGLTPANVAEAIRIVRPYGVDVSSGVESSRGVKDHRLIEKFCEAVRRADLTS
ncbi:MAG: phosphoribosylanthranilate isomerase [Tepidisphaera sp.]